jgi:hypothetical protein
MEWQDMATAPQDGSWVLAWNPMIGTYKTRFDGKHWLMNGWGDKPGIWYPAPYGWMPLPDPPKITLATFGPTCYARS